MTTPSSLQLNKLIAITYCNIVFVAIGMATPKSSRTIATKIYRCNIYFQIPSRLFVHLLGKSIGLLVQERATRKLKREGAIVTNKALVKY